MKRLMAIFCMPLVAGCLTASDPDVTFWPLEYQGRGLAAADAARYGVVRMLSVSVRPPYAERRLSVLRANGSIAFDPCHEFAASPSLLARSVVAEAMVASGLFKSVVGPSSSIASDVSAEVVISRLALDCREANVRTAVAEVMVRLVRNGERVSRGAGLAAIDAADGRYGVAFSQALSQALDKAFASLE